MPSEKPKNKMAFLSILSPPPYVVSKVKEEENFSNQRVYVCVCCVCVRESERETTKCFSLDEKVSREEKKEKGQES